MAVVIRNLLQHSALQRVGRYRNLLPRNVFAGDVCCRSMFAEHVVSSKPAHPRKILRVAPNRQPDEQSPFYFCRSETFRRLE